MNTEVTHDRKEKDSSLKKEKILKLGMRGSIIALRDAGHKMESISSILNCTRQTISKWLKRYNRDGIAGLEDRPRSGRRRKLNSKELIRIENSITSLSETKKNLLTQSGEFIFRRYIPKVLNSLSKATIYRSLKKMNFKKLIPRPVHAKKSEELCTKWLKNIRSTIYRFKRKYSKKEIGIYFQDETRFGQQTEKYKILAKRGSRPKYQKQNGFLNSWIYGAVSPKAGKKFG